MGIEIDRHHSMLKEAKTMLIRYAKGYYKIPLGVFAIFGVSVLMVAIVGSIYYNVGQIDPEEDIPILRKRFQEWLGLAYYLGND